MDRHEIDRALAQSPVIGSEPREGLYKHIHPHRMRLNGVLMQSKVWLKARTRNDSPVPFLIYGRPRSGTTLLVNVLNQIPNVRCDGELLHDLILRPTDFLRDLPKRAGASSQAYGVKLLSYQLMEVQRVVKPIAFFDKLTGMDYKIIHLTRNTWGQTLSLVKAQHSGLYFGESQISETLRIDPEKFLQSLKWNMAMLEYEHEVMSHVEHMHIHYDTDLKKSEPRNETIGNICDMLGLEAEGPFEPTLERTGGKNGPQEVENMDEIMDLVRAEGLGHLIPQRGQRSTPQDAPDQDATPIHAAE